MRKQMLTAVVVGAALGFALLGVGAGPHAGAQAPGLEAPQVSDLSAMEPNAEAVWQASYRTRGSQVAAMLPGLDVLWRWSGQRWQPYATGQDGALLPGAADFIIETGDQLWIGDWDPSQLPPPSGVIIAEGRRAGLLADRNVLGDPDAPVLILDYSDFL